MKYTCDRINSCAENPEKFVDECAEKYRAAVTDCAEKIFADTDKKIVMLAGPSSSGKTTTAKILSGIIEKLGGNAYSVSLDDFYRSHNEPDYPRNEKGEEDYECVESLAVDLIREKIASLVSGKETLLPEFDFSTGMRNDDVKSIDLGENDIIIIEGLHALNPLITQGIDEKNLFKIYVSVSTRIYEDNGDVLLSKRDLRFIRRAVRDYFTRSMSIKRTFDIWQSVSDGEDKYLFPFEDYADVKIDSFHPCEPCLIKDVAIGLLSEEDFEEYSEKAEQLREKLKKFRSIDASLLPEDSVLKEFIP